VIGILLLAEADMRGGDPLASAEFMETTDELQWLANEGLLVVKLELNLTLHAGPVKTIVILEERLARQEGDVETIGASRLGDRISECSGPSALSYVVTARS
jgi:hypothetical protein